MSCSKRQDAFPRSGSPGSGEVLSTRIIATLIFPFEGFSGTSREVPLPVSVSSAAGGTGARAAAGDAMAGSCPPLCLAYHGCSQHLTKISACHLAAELGSQLRTCSLVAIAKIHDH